MKKILCLLMIASMLLAMTGCGKTKTLHCDDCNKEITVKENSDMNEDWNIFCEDCEAKRIGDK